MSVLVLKGKLIECRRKVKKYGNGHDSAEKLFISLADVDINKEQMQQLEDAFKDSGKKFTPSWISEFEGYVNVSSRFEIPCELPDGTAFMSVEDAITDGFKWMKADVKLSINIKEGAVYPKALLFLSEGEDRDAFADFDE